MTKGTRCTLICIAICALAASLMVAAPAQAAAKNSCLDCHSYMGRASLRVVAEWKDGIHAKKGILCTDCHGGNSTDPTMGAMRKAPDFKGAPKKQDIPALCAKCHADPKYMRQFNVSSMSQFAEYKQSVHGKRLLEQGDVKVAACTDCHGTHGIRAKNDVLSSVYKTNIPKTCAKCHADPRYMAPYGIPTNQYSDYMKSYHAQKLLKEGDLSAPVCSDCHGTHGATPPGVKEVPNVCGTCHARTQEYFEQGGHAAAFRKTGTPRCVNCHDNHAIIKPGDDMLVGSSARHCGSCHKEGSPALGEATDIHRLIQGLEKDYNQAAAALERAETANMDVQDQVAELENARTNLVSARALQHTVSTGKVQEAITPALATISSVNKAAAVALDASHRRNTILLMMGLVVIFTAAVLYWKWRLAYERWIAG